MVEIIYFFILPLAKYSFLATDNNYKNSFIDRKNLPADHSKIVIVFCSVGIYYCPN